MIATGVDGIVFEDFSPKQWMARNEEEEEEESGTNRLQIKVDYGMCVCVHMVIERGRVS